MTEVWIPAFAGMTNSKMNSRFRGNERRGGGSCAAIASVPLVFSPLETYMSG
jgi:hypothetical protein